jgi:glucose/arabinose dehydrogenase
LITKQFSLELICSGLSFPTSLTFDSHDGNAYVAEAGLPFGDSSRAGGRVWKIDLGRKKSSNYDWTLVADSFGYPLNGLTFHNDSILVSEGGYPGRIIRLELSGQRQIVLDGLPGGGDYHTNMIAVGPDEKLYFSQGAMTNSGIIGLDSYDIAWLKQIPHGHDIPGYNITLSGINVETVNPFSRNGGHETVKTGAFVPFGNETYPDQNIPAQLPCTASIMSCKQDGKGLELVAWGLRNSYGLGFLPDDRLLAIDQGADDRGSRPIGNAPDLLYEIHKGGWYGWPDFIGGEPVTTKRYSPTREPAPAFVLSNHDKLPVPEEPLLRLPAHCGATKFDMISSEISTAYSDLLPDNAKGMIFVALFGDEKPVTAPSEGPPIGRNLVMIDPTDWTMHSFINEPLVRPIDVRFNVVDEKLYVLDFGYFEIGINCDVMADTTGGKLWRVIQKEY